MHVVLFYHERLPVERYGGTERVVVWLARGLAELGHQVSLVAGEGSRVPEARLIPVDPRRASQYPFDIRPHLPAGADVVHAHRPFEPIDPIGVPYLWTHHGNAKPKGPRYPGNMVCVSADHARRHGVTAFVHNGLDVREYQFQPVKGDYDLFLGRLNTAKGWRWAIDGARAANRKLVVAGGWRPTLRPGLRFVGEVGGEEKRSLLAEAACLWMPAQWDEPFGLTLIEALASGTPVLGTNRGALPEIVTEDVGCLGDTVEELVELRSRIGSVAPDRCRARVIERFSHLTMAEGYLALYAKAIAAGSLDPAR
jgi:glycosyltransferase involved in cell wall biosynthesis